MMDLVLQHKSLCVEEKTLWELCVEWAKTMEKNNKKIIKDNNKPENEEIKTEEISTNDKDYIYYLKKIQKHIRFTLFESQFFMKEMMDTHKKVMTCDEINEVLAYYLDKERVPQNRDSHKRGEFIKLIEFYNNCLYLFFSIKTGNKQIIFIFTDHALKFQLGMSIDQQQK